MENNVVSDKLKVSNSLTLGGTFVVYIVHSVFVSKIAVSKIKYILS